MLNAQDKVDALYHAISSVVSTLPNVSQIVFVDDRSTDKTWEAITRLAEQDSTLIGLRLAANVGQTNALCAAFSIATGEIIVGMDDDLESDPVGMIAMLAAIDAGAEFATGRRQGHRPLIRRIGSRAYNTRLRSLGFPFQDAGCSFGAVTNELAKRIQREGWAVRQHRFKPRVAQLTSRITEVPIPAGAPGKSHYDLRYLAASWLDVELIFGSLTTRRFTIGGILLPATVAIGTLYTARDTRCPRRLRLLAAAIGVGAMTIAKWNQDLLRLRTELERRTHREQPWTISETIGGSTTS